ncbi:uncharacterized protein LOC135501069 isoform X2 [Lineus longissimus]|uniref:uncharacterized protein LOC135501069 isoform X2 n=1 Tax=Lineus longissimus TaxID=88925 RepID=UPI00315DF5C4
MGELDKPWHRLLILAIIGAGSGTTIRGQFTFTGFPTALKGSSHNVTCSYPGATSYTWRFRGGTYNGAAYTFTVDGAKHVGVWECDAVVNGVTKTGKEDLLVYCDGVYVTGASTTNPSIGDPIELSCNVINPSGRQVQWLLTIPGANEKTIAAVTKSRCEYYHAENDNIKFAPSTTCATSTTNHFFTLNIKEVSSAHAGYWSCYDFGKSGCYSKPVRIAIAKPPKDPPTLTGFNNPIAGRDHNLTCDAWQPDVRPLTYTWYKDGVQVSSGNTSTWRLQPVKKESSGRYKCEAVDKMKNLKVEAEDTLIVYYAAERDPAVEKDETMPVRTGESVNLTLNILVYPLPTSIEWFTEEGNTTVNFNTTKISDTKWILTIPNVQEVDYGNYTANITNAAGNTLIRFKIIPPSPPNAPSDLKALPLKDTNALTVKFTAGSDGGAPQNFTIEYNIKGESKEEYSSGIEEPVITKTVLKTIENLRSDTLYQIKVKAINEFGSSGYTEVIEAKTEAAAMPVWQIAAFALAALVLLVVIFLVIFFVSRKKYKEKPVEAKGKVYSKRPVSSFVPAGVQMMETTDEGVDNPVMIIKDDKELDKIEPVEDIPVTRRFYHELNARVKRDSRKSMASPFVKSELVPVDEYSMVNIRNKTRNKNQENARQSKATTRLYAAVDFAKKKFRKESNTGDNETDSKQKTPPSIGVDGTSYTEVKLAKNRPPIGKKPETKRKPKQEERTPYAQVDFHKGAPNVATDDFEMI